jgi:hypothetical protein
MARVLIHVEGETEERFVNEILAPRLISAGFKNVGARIIGHSHQRIHRGGIRAWSTVRKDIVNHLREDSKCLATTMFDYYALPQAGDKAWPGRKDAGMLPFNNKAVTKAVTIETALSADIRREMGDGFDPRRFIPFVVMHEFEGLLFSDCDAFSRGIGHPELFNKFQEIRDEFSSPEEINDSPETAPSKRVQKLFPGYDKPLMGTLAVRKIGLAAIRGQCPHFNSWLEQLETSLRRCV